MFLAVAQRIANADDEDGAKLLRSLRFPLFGGSVRIHLEQLLGMDEGDVVGQGRGDVRIPIIDQRLDLLQEGVELAHGLLQEVQVAILRADGLLPIPLIYIERVEVV